MKRNAIYNYIATRVQSRAYCTSRKTIKPTSYPAVCITQFGNERTQRAQTLNDTDGVFTKDIEVNVMSKTQNEAYDISEYIDGLMKGLHFRLISQVPVDNTETYEVASHFRRTVGDDEQI